MAAFGSFLALGRAAETAISATSLLYEHCDSVAIRLGWLVFAIARRFDFREF